MRTKELLAGLLVLVLAGCSSGATTAPSVEPSADVSPLASEASAPSPAPTSTATVLDVKVTFDGETCAYLGPSVILDGTVLRFEYAPDQEASDSDLLVYGVEQGVSYQMLLAHLQVTGGEDVTAGVPLWVILPTVSVLNGPGTMLYTVESVKQTSDLVDLPGGGSQVAEVEHEVGAYQVLCATPAVHPAVQLTVARP